MQPTDYLMRRQNAELNHAMLETCPEKRSRHEQQARAYGKIIAVLTRENVKEKTDRRP